MAGLRYNLILFIKCSPKADPGNGFNELPKDVKKLVLSYLDVSSLLSFCATSKESLIIGSDRVVWTDTFRRAFADRESFLSEFDQLLSKWTARQIYMGARKLVASETLQREFDQASERERPPMKMMMTNLPACLQTAHHNHLADHLSSALPAPTWLTQTFKAGTKVRPAIPAWFPSVGFAFVGAAVEQVNRIPRQYEFHTFPKVYSNTIESMLRPKESVALPCDFDGTTPLQSYPWFHPDFAMHYPIPTDFLCVSFSSPQQRILRFPGSEQQPPVEEKRLQIHIQKGTIQSFPLILSDGSVVAEKAEIDGVVFPNSCPTIADFVDSFLQKNPNFVIRRWPLAPI